MSSFGEWSTDTELPSFRYARDVRTDSVTEWDRCVMPPTRRQVHVTGNQRLTLLADNEGRTAVLDEAYGLRWLTPWEPYGTGETLLEHAGRTVGTAVLSWPVEMPELSFEVDGLLTRIANAGVHLSRRVYCPYGESPWVLVDLDLENPGDEPVQVTVIERWHIWAEWLNLKDIHRTEDVWEEISVDRRAEVTSSIRYDVALDGRGVTATESRPEPGSVSPHEVFGPKATIRLECLSADVRVQASTDDDSMPTLELRMPLHLAPRGRSKVTLRFGLIEQETSEVESIGSPRDSLGADLPRVEGGPPHWQREARWHAAMLLAGTSVDRVLGGHTLNQGSAYQWLMATNAAARDPLQHALPLVYYRPDLALSILRNTCSWASPEAVLPYALSGAKERWTALWEPSDQGLWALWLAAEYLAATGDLDGIAMDTPFHPQFGSESCSLTEHLRRHHRYFVDVVGRGAHGHVRMMNADWNDVAIAESGVSRQRMWQEGESVLNSAMAATILPIWAGAARRMGLQAEAQEADALAAELTQAVASEWNGRWFRRAYGPGVGPIGEDDMWLEVQPWAMLCGAASKAQAFKLMEVLDNGARAGSPVGARVKWPIKTMPQPGTWPLGEGTNGGTWFSINMTLIWAYSRWDRARAIDELDRMTLHRHTQAYPDQWIGTLSGPDSYNSPESARPGQTWSATHEHAMQAFPIGNMHAHGQPLLSYLRVLGVEPLPSGALAVGAGHGAWSSGTFTLDETGHGRLMAKGPVTIVSPHGLVEAEAGHVAW